MEYRAENSDILQASLILICIWDIGISANNQDLCLIRFYSDLILSYLETMLHQTIQKIFWVLFRVFFLNSLMSYLCLYTEKGGKESCNSDCCKILGGEVSVESLQLVEGQHDTQKVDQDPEGIQNIMTIWTLSVIIQLRYQR